MGSLPGVGEGPAGQDLDHAGFSRARSPVKAPRPGCLLPIGGSVLGGIVAFAGAMLYVGIANTYRLVVGAWGFTILIVLALAWLARRLREGTQ